MNRAAVLVTLLAPALVGAAEPQIAFTVEGPFAKFHLSRDGQPVEGVVKVFDAAGNSFAEGETEARRGTFPLPRGDEFTLEVTLGDRTADTITVSRDGTTLTPATVLLSFGLKPCCRVPSRGSTITSTELPGGTLPLTLLAVGAGLSLLVGSALVYLAFRPERSQS